MPYFRSFTMRIRTFSKALKILGALVFIGAIIFSVFNHQQIIAGWLVAFTGATIFAYGVTVVFRFRGKVVEAQGNLQQLRDEREANLERCRQYVLEIQNLYPEAKAERDAAIDGFRNVVRGLRQPKTNDSNILNEEK